MFACPQRCIFEKILPNFHYPFGNIPARNILEGFDGFEPAEDDGTGLNVNNYIKVMSDCGVLIEKFFPSLLSFLGALFGLW